MLRRKYHIRSTKGCATCKERHVRCDERRPYCRNCVRLGRICQYDGGDSPSRQDRGPTETAPLPSSAATTDAGGVGLQHAVYYCAPHLQNIPSRTIAIIQQSQLISRERPMPQGCMVTITSNYLPRYNHVAGQHDSAKHALASFAAYTHYQATKSPVSLDVWLKHTSVALKELRKQIDSFSPANADGVVTASVALASAAHTWEQWAIFVDGYSRALSYIKINNLSTTYPDLLGERFLLRQISSIATTTPAVTPLVDRIAMEQGVALVIDSVIQVRDAVGLVRWQVVGFKALEKLSQTVLAALSFTNDADVYHQLAWLRSWMFWIELREGNSGDEQSSLTAHFFALILAIIALFPQRFFVPLARLCVDKITSSRARMTDSAASSLGLTRISSVISESISNLQKQQ